MIDYLSNKLVNVFSKLKSVKQIDEKSLNLITQDIKVAFLESDINYQVTIDFINKIKKDLINIKLEKGESLKNRILIAFENEMLSILGNEYNINYAAKLNYMMILGLQGTGKTTTVSKLANYFTKKHNKKVLVVACDANRPAAFEQLEKLCEQIPVEVFFKANMSPIEIVKHSLKYIDESDTKYDIVLFDTAGRTAVDEKLLQELVDLQKLIRPRETILNLDAMAGQSVINTINIFKEKIKINCAILTKFDSEARSGAAFSVSYLAKIPIVFTGVGEKITDLDKFYPDRVVKRIMGYGDLLTLTEKASETFDEKSTKSMIKRMMSGKFDLEDLLKQMEKMKKLGPLKSLIKMVPGMPSISSEQMKTAENKLKIVKVIANSTTLKERRNIALLTVPSRKNRIIKGSGVTQQQYNILLKQIKQMKEQAKQLKQYMGQKGKGFGV